MTENKYKITVNACFLAYIVQAIVNNFAPLLFVTFQNEFNIPLSKITVLVTVNFLIQLFVDLVSAKFVDKIGYKPSMIIAHFLCAFGLMGLTFLPGILSNSFVGLLLAVMIYAVGGGLLEVLVSPVVEACPTDNKEKAMSLLHSFYCWGQMGVVLISTLFFSIFNIGNWKILAVLWSVVPIINASVFMKAPFASLNEEGETGMSILELCKNKLFWILFVMMVCAGASEQGVSQWASAFAEKGLGVSKTVGDLAGPMAFACLMGISRAFYGKFGDKIDLDKFMNITEEKPSEHKQERVPMVDPCYYCLCRSCINNAESLTVNPEEVPYDWHPCFFCDICNNFDGESPENMEREECEEYMIDDYHARQNRKKFRIVR